jgi:class 3 adenylate cyclase
VLNIVTEFGGCFMESKYKSYDFSKSLERMDEILNSNSFYEDNKTFPKRDDLTFTNGYYVNVTSLFIDLRDSSKMTDLHTPKVLAKIYRSYISEAVAIINDNNDCKEINIVGDCVSAVFNTPFKSDIDLVIEVAARLNSLVDVLNYKLRKKKYNEINAGIGLSFGRVLMIKAGYKGSTINDVVYMGDAVNKASKMCSRASKDWHSRIVLTPELYDNINKQEYKDLFSEKYETGYPLKKYYHGKPIIIEMNEWLNDKMKDD